MSGRLKAALVGFGRIAAGYADDPRTARHYRYASHAQVLRDHPAFELAAAVDTEAAARDLARARWSIPAVAATCRELGAAAEEIDVVVLATPPEARRGALDAFPHARGALVEKPLGSSIEESRRFVGECRARKLLVQVNFWRRADEAFRRLAQHELASLVGPLQCGFGLYCNGFLNNGIHMIDFARMLLGEASAVDALRGSREHANPAFALHLAAGGTILFHPVDAYREVGVDFWGRRGRLAIENEGLTILHYPQQSHRALTGASEIACDTPRLIPSTVGHALFRLYTNLAESLAGTAEPWSTLESALASTVLAEAVLESARTGRVVTPSRGV